ncbi:MAG: pentapeptide repeat-containing protein [Archangiaceae bacterium]|nr:pentapeptide repeat-containing protein [Archangiaceae bacterium]
MKTMILMAMVVAGTAAAQGKDLRGAYLFEAKLQNADLRGANLAKTQLGRADLRGADFRGAKLTGAYLHKADLSNADLRGAELLSKANGAELNQVNLTGARFDAKTQLPFAEQEALRRGMVKMEVSESPELPACNDVAKAPATGVRA